MSWIRTWIQTREGRVRIGLGLALVLVLCLIIGTDNPFEAGIGIREAEGRKPKPLDWWASYGWPFAVVGAVFLTALLTSVPRWLGREEPIERSPAAPPTRTRIGVALVVLAMLVGGALGFPRLSMSLWDDEAYTVDNHIVGRWKIDDRDGSWEFDGPRWSETLFGYSTANNHVAFSVLARLSSKIAWSGEKPKDRMIDERAVRAPAFVAGILSIGALAWFLWRAGFGAAAVLAAWLLALHPWALRYLSEARGYSMAALLGSALFACGLAALRQGWWRRWIALGAAQAVLIWTFAPSVYLVATVNLAIGATLVGRRREADGLEQLTRWLLANLGSGLFWLMVMGPNLPQLARYIERSTSEKVWMTHSFLRNMTAHFAAGSDWRHRGWPTYPELGAVADLHPMLVWGAVALLLALFVAGGVRLLRAGGTARLLAFMLLLPGPLAFLQLWITNARTYVWYFVIFLPSAIALIALGATWAAARPWTGLRGRLSGVLLSVLALASVVWMGGPARNALRERSWFQIRESVHATRSNLDPNDPANLEILTVSWSSPPYHYDPLHRWVGDLDELRALMTEADTTGKALYVNLGRIGLAERNMAGGVALLRDESLFEQVVELPGFTPDRTRWVWRYLGRPASPE
ncbi:MAG: hypothetical protein GY723_08060 [bacterium]|nr:hypothetical protein [bacterium]MCP5066007.1 hypothetical protein [bacterium]